MARALSKRPGDNTSAREIHLHDGDQAEQPHPDRRFLNIFAHDHAHRAAQYPDETEGREIEGLQHLLQRGRFGKNGRVVEVAHHVATRATACASTLQKADEVPHGAYPDDANVLTLHDLQSFGDRAVAVDREQGLGDVESREVLREETLHAGPERCLLHGGLPEVTHMPT